MAIMVMNSAVDDYEGFVRGECPSVEQAKAFRDHLLASGSTTTRAI